MTGSCDRASQPIADETTGTGRQPRTFCPSSATIAFERPLADQPLAPRSGQEHERDAVLAGRRAARSEISRLGPEERVGQLDQDPGPVARVLVAAAGPAMLEVPEELQSALHRGVALPPVQVGHEPHAARVPLEGRVVKPFPSRTEGGRSHLDRRDPP